MKKLFIISILFLLVFLNDSACNTNVLKAGIESSDFGIAFIGVGFALLIRGGNKK